jgi:uncharacterized protein YutE (UPF0331/DUF86 family)/predicted nucleotidyltransferase
MPSKLRLLPADIAERLKELPERMVGIPGVAAVWLFGSFARGEATPISDVDLAYLPDEPLAGDALDRFETALYSTIAATLQSDEFSLANLRTAPAYFSGQVLREGRVLLCRDLLAVARLVEDVCRIAPDTRLLRHRGNLEFEEALSVPESRIDRDRVVEFLRLLSDDLKALREKAQVPKEVYANSRDIQAIVERRLQTAIESCINIGNHLIARLGLRPPVDYADVFRGLAEGKLLPGELAQQMMDMARFRNLLVHVYWSIDHERVYDALAPRLTTLETFARRIAEWLKDHAAGQ